MARRAFPLQCFQLLPLAEVVSRSFEDIIASGSEIQVYDKELLRDPQYTVFLRQCANYGLTRFLGIMVCTHPFTLRALADDESTERRHFPSCRVREPGQVPDKLS